MIVFKGKRKDKTLDRMTGVVVHMQANGWITEELTLQWLIMLWEGLKQPETNDFSSGMISEHTR
jgi:hypothetical protein